MAFLELLMRVRNPVLDYIAMAISYLGTPFVVVGIIAFLALNDDRNRAEGMMLAFLFSGLLCQGMKIVFHIPRPWVLVTDPSVFSPVTMALPTATGYSFPSIHTQSTAALCLAVIYYNKKKTVRVSAIIFLVLVAFSRMYLGCHTPQDVVVAFLLTLAVTVITLPLWRRFSQKNALNREIFSFFVSGFSLILIFLSTVLTGNGTVDAALSDDAFQTAGLGLGFAFSMMLMPRLPDGRNSSVVIKLVRYGIVLAGFLVLEFGFPAVIPDSFAADTVLYGLISFWLFAAGPVVLSRTRFFK